MKMKVIAPVLATSLLLLTGCSSRQRAEMKEKRMAESERSDVATQRITTTSVAKLTESWPTESRAAANALIAKYGLPAEATPSLMVWNETPPLKRTVVHRDIIGHDFPTTHFDVVEQSVNYRVPAEKIDDLAKFDGSLFVDRTRGELTSRADREEMNILAFNLADKIVRGEMSADMARREYSNSANQLSMGNTTEYFNGLNFQIADKTADPDMMVRPGSESKMIRRTIETKETREHLREAQESME